MNAPNSKTALISGASFAGLSTAFWLTKLGYKVTVVEVASGLRMGGTAVDIRGNTVDTARRMGLLAGIQANRLALERSEFKNADDITERTMVIREEGQPPSDEEFEIERSVLLHLLMDRVKNDADLRFNASIAALADAEAGVQVTFKDGSQDTFDLVFGCDGIHSAVRRLWFGDESQYTHFLQQYFSITIVDKLLIPVNTLHLFNAPGKGAMLNAYKNKTDIVLCFVSDDEIAYDHRNEAQQRLIVAEQFAGVGWRTAELLEEVNQSKTFYFDKLCQIRMPSWTKGRVALVGDAAYCASPAAGMGGSLAIDGAAALAAAMEKYPDNYERAFQEYNESFRPFIEEIQAEAVKTGLEVLVPRTAEAIRLRNSGEGPGF